MKRLVSLIKKSIKMKAELMKTRTLLKAIQESSPDIIVFALDTKYRYLTFNSKHKETMKKIWGKEIKVGMSIFDIIGHSKDQIKSKENFDKALAGKRFSLAEEYGYERLSRMVWNNYYAPIYTKDGKIIGLTCFVINITERIRAKEEITYLSYHDELTGLYNRRFLQAEINRLDTERNLPISIIIGDMNGLKLANDIYGHSTGDLLLKKLAEVLKKVCRADDIIARTGGDEFTILLPNTTKEDTEGIIERIITQFSNEKVKTIKGSISMGCATKINKHEDILSVLEIAERHMYFSKTLEGNLINDNTPNTIIRELHLTCPREEEHSKNVSKLCEDMGRAMKLPETDIKKLKDAGYLHDIGKVVLDENLLNNAQEQSPKIKKEMKRHAVVGYRILNFSPDTLDLADAVLTHHERWDGNGYPKGLKGEEIPLMARIISVVEGYDHMTNKLEENAISKEEAIEKIESQAGAKFDPGIVDVFVKMMKKP
ncbi:MAG: diguanylate cyclase [Tissierellaceae bacterium]|nr:diguanylate cyclase [Tissierellaceae bacterium]